MSSLALIGGILWYGLGLFGIGVAFYALVYFGKLFDITKNQLLGALLGGIILSALSDAFFYFSSTHMPLTLYDQIYRYTALSILPAIMVCLVYFLVAGNGNLRKNYGINISGHWPNEIRKLKESHQ